MNEESLCRVKKIINFLYFKMIYIYMMRMRNKLIYFKFLLVCGDVERYILNMFFC